MEKYEVSFEREREQGGDTPKVTGVAPVIANSPDEAAERFLAKVGVDIEKEKDGHEDDFSPYDEYFESNAGYFKIEGVKTW